MCSAISTMPETTIYRPYQSKNISNFLLMLMDTAHHPSIPVSGFWRTLSAAFTSASLIAPPPMSSHMFHRTKANSIGTMFSTFDCSENHKYLSPLSHLFFMNKFLNKGTEKIETNVDVLSRVTAPRIAIIGGGIAGVTAADAIVKRLNKEQKNNAMEANIVIFESDSKGGQRSVTFDSCQQPVWTAGESMLGSTIDTHTERYSRRLFIHIESSHRCIFFISTGSNSSQCKQHGSWCRDA
jgi:hypothetical protein